MTGRPPAGGKLDICGTRRRPESSAAWIVQLSGGLTACPGRKQTWLGAGEQALDVRVGGALAAEAVAVEGPVAVGGAGRLQAQLGGPGPPAGPVRRRLVGVVDLEPVQPGAGHGPDDRLGDGGG